MYIYIYTVLCVCVCVGIYGPRDGAKGLMYIKHVFFGATPVASAIYCYSKIH